MFQPNANPETENFRKKKIRGEFVSKCNGEKKTGAKGKKWISANKMAIGPTEIREYTQYRYEVLPTNGG